MKEIILAYLLQLAFTVGIVVLFGFIISVLNRLFYSNFGVASKAVAYVTGFIGTPIHELSHALFCLLFFHKINEIKLFTIGDDGTLGYVSHSYNPKNFYQKLGNFFIGIAPIVVISLILYLLINFLLPTLKDDLLAVASGMSGNGAKGIFEGIGKIFLALFSYMKYPRFWIYVAVGIFLVPHMTLSAEDVKGAASGFLFLALILFVADLIVYFLFNDHFQTFAGAFSVIGAFLLTFFSLALFILLVEILISFIFKLIFKNAKK